MHGKPLNEIQVTDQDIIPLDLMKQVISQIKNKFDEKMSSYHKLVNEATLEVKFQI